MSAKIPTFDSQGKPNGWVLPIWSVLAEAHLRPDQVYLTAVHKLSRKGPHLHLRRRGVFQVVRGYVLFRLRGLPESEYGEVSASVETGLVFVQPGVACAIYNYGNSDALVLNMPSPAWSAEDPDEHPVENWEDPKDWPVLHP